MSGCRKERRSTQRFFGQFLMIVLLLGCGTALAQQETPPKAEWFIGYQWLHPGGTVPQPGNPSVGFKLPSIPQGWGSSLTYNFTPRWGLEGDYGGNYNKYANEHTASVGPRFTIRGEGFNLFAHTLVGLNYLTPKGLDSDPGFGAVLGGGMDLTVWKRMSFRLFEADYVLGRHHFASPNSDLRDPTLEGVRLRSGLVFNFGGAPEVAPTATCSVQPTEVMVGEPVTATVSGANFDAKHTLSYEWSSTGGKVTGKDTTATVDTNGVAGGSYTVTAKISDPKKKKNNMASCTANFTVKEPPKNPPTMSCTADPSNVQAGASSTITCTCTSPDNVPVNVASWTATGGSVTGNGSSATLNTSGASAGPITVSATCSDSRGLTAPASTQVTVEVPPPPPPQASKLSSCDFPNKVKPWRVDNTCKAVLDDVAQRLQHDPDSKLVIVGNADSSEKRKNLAGERAVNSKAYLSGGEAKQAIDASRIEVRTGNGGTKTADFWVVPAGATFTESDTTPVDESMVKAVPDHPRSAAKKKKTM